MDKFIYFKTKEAEYIIFINHITHLKQMKDKCSIYLTNNKSYTVEYSLNDILELIKEQLNHQ